MSPCSEEGGLFVVRNPDVVLSEEDIDEALIFNPESNEMMTLNATGLFIWRLCDGTHAVPAIATALAAEFGGAGAETVHRDVEAFLAELVRLKFAVAR